jgi:hypothetical protein
VLKRVASVCVIEFMECLRLCELEGLKVRNQVFAARDYCWYTRKLNGSVLSTSIESLNLDRFAHITKDRGPSQENTDGVPRVCAEVMLNIVCLNKCVPIHLLLSSNLL